MLNIAQTSSGTPSKCQRWNELIQLMRVERGMIMTIWYHFCLHLVSAKEILWEWWSLHWSYLCSSKSRGFNQGTLSCHFALSSEPVWRTLLTRSRVRMDLSRRCSALGFRRLHQENPQGFNAIQSAFKLAGKVSRRSNAGPSSELLM